MENITLDNQTIITLATLVTTCFINVITVLCSHRIRKIELRTQTQQHLVDLYYSEKADAFKNFVSVSSSLVIHINEGDNYELVLGSAHKALLLCNEKNKSLLNDFIQLVDARLFNREKPDDAWRCLYWNKLSAITASLNEELRTTTNLIKLK